MTARGKGTADVAREAVENGAAGAGTDPTAVSSGYLLARVAAVEDRVRAEIGRRRQERGATTDDPYLGLYVSDERADEVLRAGPDAPVVASDEVSARLAEVEAQVDAAELHGADVRLRRLARTFSLTPLDVELLLVAAAPSLDRRFEPLYGYLNDDVSQRLATAQLALLLCGARPTSAAARARLGSGAPLCDGGLLVVDDPDRPFLSRPVRVPDRVVAHLLGDDEPDAVVARLQVPAIPVHTATVDRLARALHEGHRLTYVLDGQSTGGASAAVAALAEVGLGAIVLDLERIAPDDDVATVASMAAREARLRGAALVAGPVDVVAERGAHQVRAFAEAAGTVVLVGAGQWDPGWSREVPVAVEADRIAAPERERLWSEALGPIASELGVAAATASFRLTPLQIDRAARAATRSAAAAGTAVSTEDVLRGVRAQNAAGLQRLARRIEPRVSWDDLIVPGRVEEQLRELPMRWRHRDRVLEDWGMGRGVATGRGVSALFAGPSGTGKTLAAEVVAGDLGLDLYLVDLSTVVDKYIGETSKNLERIFDEADRVNGVLLFDEADALFGKRSAVRDAKDRHANVEVAFLLQRLETFDGVSILTSNLASNLDDAFVRRLDTIIDFPAPDEHQRRALWAAKLSGGVPHSDDVDVEELARLFRLSGSEITNVVVSAAYHAADRGEAVTMRDLVAAAVREHRKIGRHVTAADLGDHADVLGPDR